jgi:formate hydrogenlyase transcriptional activator
VTLCSLSSISSIRKGLKRNSKEKTKPPVLAQPVTLSELLLRQTGLTMMRKTTKGNTKMSTGLAGITHATNSVSEQAPFSLGSNVVTLGSRRQLRRSFTTHNECAEVLAFEKPLALEELSESYVKLDTPSTNEQSRRETNFAEIIGNSAVLRHTLELTEKVASWDSTVLLLGETGTGKELVARAIHRSSDRAHRPLIRVNCAALPAELIASELKKKKKGAFTGALQQRIGRFEAANGGTIFLDEIAELSPEIQVALLRVLQEKEFERVGGNRTIKTDVRVIAATNKDLHHEVSLGRFRMDLFYRLNVFPIRVPALRERLEDIPLLVDYFAARLAAHTEKKITQIEKQSLSAMQHYSWPGNVRELQNVIERCVILTTDEVLRVDCTMLMHETPFATGAPAAPAADSDRKAQIEAVLRETRGKVYGPNGAAARLHIAGTTLDSQILALGIRKYQFK